MRPFGVCVWLPRYTVALFKSDLLASMTVAIVLVPQAMSYAKLAGLSPVYGLYTSTIPVILFGLCTSSSQVAPGPVAPTALLMLAMVTGMTSAAPFSGEFTRIHVALACVTGLVQIAMGVLQFTWVSDLISVPVMMGFSWAAGVGIIGTQLSDFFGLTGVPRESNTFLRFYRAAIVANTAQWATCIIAIVNTAVMLFAKDVKCCGRPHARKFPFPMAVIFIMTLLSYLIDFAGRIGVRIVGPIPTKLPLPSAPLSSVDDISLVIGNAIVLGIINYVQTVSLALIFGKKAGDKIEPPMEMYALGISSVIGSCA